MPLQLMNSKISDAIDTIMREISGRNQRDIAAIIHNVVSNDHRTNQQKFWSAMMLAQIMYADNASDLRNDAAVQLAKLVKDTATENNLDMGLPYI